MAGRYQVAGWDDWTLPPPPEATFMPDGQRQLWRIDGLTTAMPSIYINFFDVVFTNVSWNPISVPQWIDLSNVDGQTDTGFAFKWEYLSEVNDFIPQHLYFY